MYTYAQNLRVFYLIVNTCVIIIVVISSLIIIFISPPLSSIIIIIIIYYNIWSIPAILFVCSLSNWMIITSNAFSFIHNNGRDHDSAIPRSRFSPETIPCGLHIRAKMTS